MMTNREHDAYVSPRVAADLNGIPTARVLGLLASGAIRAFMIRGERVVSLMEVEQSIGEEGKHGQSA